MLLAKYHFIAVFTYISTQNPRYIICICCQTSLIQLALHFFGCCIDLELISISDNHWLRLVSVSTRQDRTTNNTLMGYQDKPFILEYSRLSTNNHRNGQWVVSRINAHTQYFKNMSKLNSRHGQVLHFFIRAIEDLILFERIFKSCEVQVRFIYSRIYHGRQLNNQDSLKKFCFKS